MENRQYSTVNIGIIILAAGASTRMGKPKQLLSYNGRSLIRHTVEITLASKCRPIVVVLGANAQRIQPEISNLPIQIVENQAWNLGMSSSIRVGIEAILSLKQNLKAVVIMVSAQPFISAKIINKIGETHCLTERPIVASEYAKTLGVPALFSHALFPELCSLPDSFGAKQIIKKHLNSVVPVSFPQGSIDLDTPDDYEQLQTHILHSPSLNPTEEN